MNHKYLGDSFDIVKRFWAENLRDLAPLVAHPRFVPDAIKTDFKRVVMMPVLDLNIITVKPFGLFLDPDTGIPLPTAPMQRDTASHAPVSFIADELKRLDALYLVCFDQSHDRACRLTKTEQRMSKSAALRTLGIASFYYVSHAPFLFGARDMGTLDSVRHKLMQVGIPAWRFEGPN
jgi:hypothetical protein